MPRISMRVHDMNEGHAADAMHELHRPSRAAWHQSIVVSSNNNALAWHYAMTMSVMIQITTRHSRHELLLLVVSNNAVARAD